MKKTHPNYTLDHCLRGAFGINCFLILRSTKDCSTRILRVGNQPIAEDLGFTSEKATSEGHVFETADGTKLTLPSVALIPERKGHLNGVYPLVNSTLRQREREALAAAKIILT